MARLNRVSSQDAFKILSDVPPDKLFWLRDGRSIKNMRNLWETLEGINDELYYYHANTERNDFSIWVKDVIADGKLSRDLAKARSKEQAAKAVKQRLEFLSTKLQ